jgi:hypothetical protein
MTEPIDAATDVADSAQPDPLEMLMRKDAVKTAVSRFAKLPTLMSRQRRKDWHSVRKGACVRGFQRREAAAR